MTSASIKQHSKQHQAKQIQGVAAVLEAPKTITLQRTDLREPQGTQVRVRMEGCGVCGSNLPIWAGRPWFDYPAPPGSPGHEGWGVIDAVGPDVEDFSPGERVAALSFHAFATFDFADQQQVVRLPAALEGVPVPGEPLGCAMNVFHRSGIHSGQTVAVVGVGFLGALLIQLASSAGARVIGISRRGYSRQVAQVCGARSVVEAESPKAAEHVQELTGGEGCDCVIEATGKQGPLDLAGKLVRTRGRLVIAGFHQDGPRSVDMQSWNWRGIDVINAHERDPHVYVQGIQQAVDAMSDGRLQVSDLLTHRYPLERLDDALHVSEARPEGFLKAWIDCSQDQ